MKIKMQVMASLVEHKSYVDTKTGNARERVVATIGGLLDGGEMCSCVLYGNSDDDFRGLPKSGFVVLDCYKYEGTNALAGNCWARSFTIVK